MRKVTVPQDVFIRFDVPGGDGCSYMRGIFPAMAINYIEPKRGLRIYADYSFHHTTDLQYIKYLILHRAVLDEDLEYLRSVDRQGCRIIFDIDDLFTNIPAYNHCNYLHQHYDTICEMMSLCDGVLVSTQPLLEHYKQYNENIRLQPNRLPLFLWNTRYQVAKSDTVVFYSGSRTHFSKKMEDDFPSRLRTYINKGVKGVKFVFMGAHPYKLKKSKFEFIPYKPGFYYPLWYQSICPDIIIAPLQDNEFNSCKSNIKMLEAVSVGAAGLYSDVMPYQKAKFKAADGYEFVSMLDNLIKDKELRDKNIAHDFKQVGGELYLENNIIDYLNTIFALGDETIN